jgi:hypothetical protein
VEVAIARLLDRDPRVTDRRRRIEERDGLPVACARGSARDAGRHQRPARLIERRELCQSRKNRRREHVRIRRLHPATNLQKI